MSHRQRRRSLSFESLEGRALLAGNVTATVVDGVLTIKGDNADNRIYIRQLDPQGQPVTTVNGQTSLVVEGVKNGISINLGNGNDFVNVSRPNASRNAATVPGKLAIDMGAGNDGVRLYVVNRTEVVVRAGVGGDGVNVTGEVAALNIASDGLWANAPGSYDSVWLKNLTVKQQATVNTGAAGDLFLADSLSLDGPLALAMEGGNDMVRAVLRTTSPAATVDINMGGGNDDVTFGYDFGVLIQQKAAIRIDMGAGNDGLRFQNIGSTDRVDLNTGSGNDTVYMNGVAVDSLFVSLGEDDDSLTLHSGIHSQTSDLDGGAGTDTLVQEDSSIDLGNATITGFEQ